MTKILIIDDDQDFLYLMTQYLKRDKYEIYTSHRSDLVMQEIESFCPDLIISDIMMPGITGASIYEAVRKNFTKHLPIIVCSGTSMKFKNAKDTLLDYCPKPIDFKKLSETIVRLLEQSEEQKKNNP
jgi:DNA-binding NtrC family response regulator